MNDQRSRVKRKAAEIKTSQQKTGGGIDVLIEPLTIEDENILKLMGGNIVVSGDDQIKEAGLPMLDVVSILHTFSNNQLYILYIFII